MKVKKLITSLIIAVASLSLLVAAACLAGCAAKRGVKGRRIFGNDVKEISFSESDFSSYIGITDDKAEIDDILNFFYGLDFYKTEKDELDIYLDCAGVAVVAKNSVSYIHVYPDGTVTVEKSYESGESTEYYSTENNAVNHGEFLEKLRLLDLLAKRKVLRPLLRVKKFAAALVFAGET